MKKDYRSIVIAATLLLFFILFFRSVWQKQQTITNGTLVLLELAPVDPRSLMQGDYMDLNYDLQNKIEENVTEPRGYAFFKVDSLGIGQLVKFSKDLIVDSEKGGLVPIKYFNGSSWRISIGAESYFFQEGQASYFEEAKYGGLRVDDNGNSVLIGLYDSERNLIVAPDVPEIEE